MTAGRAALVVLLLVTAAAPARAQEPTPRSDDPFESLLRDWRRATRAALLEAGERARDVPADPAWGWTYSLEDLDPPRSAGRPAPSEIALGFGGGTAPRFDVSRGFRARFSMVRETHVDAVLGGGELRYRLLGLRSLGETVEAGLTLRASWWRAADAFDTPSGAPNLRLDEQGLVHRFNYRVSYEAAVSVALQGLAVRWRPAPRWIEIGADLSAGLARTELTADVSYRDRACALVDPPGCSPMVAYDRKLAESHWLPCVAAGIEFGVNLKRGGAPGAPRAAGLGLRVRLDGLAAVGKVRLHDETTSIVTFTPTFWTASLSFAVAL
ncbi:MAG: hypothetical protein L0216_04365 [Planctomycetales bacterium]|nr:hypothetical protein [Planctomycetales bacterium]